MDALDGYWLVAAGVILGMVFIEAMRDPTERRRRWSGHGWIPVVINAVGIALLWPAALLFVLIPGLLRRLAQMSARGRGSEARPGPPMTPDEARAAWKSARTFPDLCELMAGFIEGTLPYCPFYGEDTVDEETGPLVPALAELNRSGFLTVCSQPGAEGQRAYVEGFATPDVALRIAQKALYSSLYVDFVPPEAPAAERASLVPLVMIDGYPHGWLNGTPAGAEVESPWLQAGLHDEALESLGRTWWVGAADLEWGREEYLWRVLLEPPRPGYSINPHPDLDVGTWYDEPPALGA